jgi:AcrR family transcriptional regulator
MKTGRAASSEPGSPALTLLERQLAGERKAPVTPLDAFRAARRRFLRSERVDMGSLAAELGIGRATLYRWVGDRDRLLGEILWSLAEGALRRCREEARGEGADWVIDVYTRFGELIVETPPVLRFVRSEPETALRVMTTKHSPNQARVVGFFRETLEEAAATRGLRLRLDAHTLAYVLVRVAESFLWTDLITGEPPDQSKAEEVARVLIG